jgi:isopentenyl-diphosphate delta-isomerase
MERNKVILVNEQDKPLGSMEKMEAHKAGVLHRAFSVFIFNSNGELLLQQRAQSKYHSGGLWTNTCCSHPQPGEDTNEAAKKRLQEEMGFTTGLIKVFDFTYKAIMENGLIEHEFDHVFAGNYDGPVPFNTEEVMDWSFMSIDELRSELASHPQKFTSWFRLAFPKLESWWTSHYHKVQN